jgi:hypothetical protein
MIGVSDWCDVVRVMIQANSISSHQTIYFYFDFNMSQYVPLADQPGVIVLKSLKDHTGGPWPSVLQ